MSTEPTPPAQQQATAITEVTPAQHQHHLFGKILTIIGREGELLVLEIKDGFNWIVTKIHQSQVKMIVPPAAIVQPAAPVPTPEPVVAAPPAAVAPIVEPAAPEVNPS